MTPYELGETGSPDALSHLKKHLGSPVANDARLAASAVGKIATRYPVECLAILHEMFLALDSPHSQVVQYAIKSLEKIPFEPTEEQARTLLTIGENHPQPGTRIAATVLASRYKYDNPPAKPVCTIKSGQHHEIKHNKLRLTGEQQKILTLSAKNPILIKGVAGSGKTTLAVIRARNLACEDDLFRKTKIYVFSYTQSLVKFIQGMFRDLPSENRSSIGCGTVHTWCSSFLREHGFWSKHKYPDTVLLDQARTNAIHEAKRKHPGRALWNKPKLFFCEEIAWIKNQGISSEPDYIAAKRSGRGSADRVTADDKKAIWTVFENYEHEREELSMVDFEDYARFALAQIEAICDFKPPYSHIVIDEAQDLSATQLRLIAKLVSPETRSITLIADAAQRIYKSGFTWASVGIDVRGGGRSIELTHNYRNTVEIAQAALSLLAKDPDPTDFTQPTLPARRGEKPRLILLKTFERHRQLLPDLLSRLPHTQESIVVLHRYRKRLVELSACLREAGFEVDVITDKKPLTTHAGIHLCTMSSIKGLEFDHVILTDLNDHSLPMKSGFTEPNDPLHIITERRLLYTCMTRAKQSLTIIATDPPSRYIAELDPSTLTQDVDAHPSAPAF